MEMDNDRPFFLSSSKGCIEEFQGQGGRGGRVGLGSIVEALALFGHHERDRPDEQDLQ